MTELANSPKRRTIKFASSVLIVAAVGTVLWVNAGDLNPPPGPIMATDRVTLNEQAITLPFTISQPGSYVLTSNFTGVSGQDGIVIDADDVTLDLNGFALIGVSGSLDGINMPNFHRNVVILNGNIRNWDEDGIDALIHSGRIERISASNNGGWGIDNSVLGFNVAFTAHIISCEALDNGDLVAGTGGISGFNTSKIVDCIAYSNTGPGINTNSGSTITGCTARSNTGNGIIAGTGSTITECTAQSNTGNGISAVSGSTITGCTASSNTLDGISAGTGSTITGCTASSNTLDGIGAGLGSTVTNCTATSNADDGIDAGDRCTISECTATLNDSDGISVDNKCRIVGNNCSGNTGSGIITLGDNNLVDGNTVTDNASGIFNGGSSNFFVRNYASGNTGASYFAISVGSSHGPTVDATGAGSITSVTNNDNPWANFIH